VAGDQERVSEVVSSAEAARPPGVEGAVVSAVGGAGGGGEGGVGDVGGGGGVGDVGLVTIGEDGVLAPVDGMLLDGVDVVARLSAGARKPERCDVLAPGDDCVVELES
jgi:hypothetical protein